MSTWRHFQRFSFLSIFLIFSLMIPILSFPIYAEDELEIHLLSINDFHGQLDTLSEHNNRPVGTAPFLAAYLRQEYEKDPQHTLFVTAGDTWGGSPMISSIHQDEPTLRLLNKLGFTVGIPGNHEFDEGYKEFMRMVKGGKHKSTGLFEGATFPYIAANVVYKETKKTILPPSLIKEIDGIKIGFIGVTTRQTPNIVFSKGIENIEFTDEAEAINREATLLKQKGIETIIVLAHEGDDREPGTEEIAKNITGPIAEISKKINPSLVDAIFSAHSHTNINGICNNILVLQASNYGKAYSKIDLTIDKKTGKVIDKKGRIQYTYRDQIAPDPKVSRFIEKLENKVRSALETKIATIKSPILSKENEAGESPLGNLISDAQRHSAEADFALIQRKGMRIDIPAGLLTLKTLAPMHPFGNKVVKMELTGEQIKRILNQQFDNESPTILKPSGFKFSYDPKRPKEDRIVEMTHLDGTPIDLKKTYTMAVNSFLACGGDGFTGFKEGKNEKEGAEDLSALIDYLQFLPQPIEPKMEGRIKRIQ